MSEVLHANIFFVVASVATVLFVLLVSVALYQVIKILTAIRTIIERIAAGSDVLADDVSAMRAFVKGGGLIASIVNLVRPKKSARSRSQPAHDDDMED